MTHHDAIAPNFKPSTMRPAEAARYVGVSTSKLAKLRLKHNRHSGPSFIKLSGCILYRQCDLDRWLDQHTISCATEALPG